MQITRRVVDPSVSLWIQVSLSEKIEAHYKLFYFSASNVKTLTLMIRQVRKDLLLPVIIYRDNLKEL